MISFSRIILDNISCFKCGEKRKDGLQLELDDEQNKQSLNEAYNWICQSCGYMHFKDNLRCLNCNLPKESTKSSWICTYCKNINKTQRSSCFFCHKFKIQLKKPECVLEFWKCSLFLTKNEISKLKCQSCTASKYQTTATEEELSEISKNMPKNILFMLI